MRTTEANLKKTQVERDELKDRTTFLDEDWAQGLATTLAACTLKERRENAILDPKSGKYKNVINLAGKMKKDLQDIRLDAHGAQLA